MKKHYQIAIIGAGTAGLSAYKEAKKYTQDIVLIDSGPLGSTCARVGCMPSKLLIHVANAFYARHHFSDIGILGVDSLSINLAETLSYVRSLRDHFTKGVIEFTQSLEKHFICASASFVDANTLSIDDKKITAEKIIIATGSSSVVPGDWCSLRKYLLTTESIFEQKDILNPFAVIGGGVVGLELGQALARLGVDLTLYHANGSVAGLTDPVVNEIAIKIFQEEFSLCLNEKVDLNESSSGLVVKSTAGNMKVKQALVSIGRSPNLKALNLAALDIAHDKNGIPEFDPQTMKIKNYDIYIAGDVNKMRPLLHEAADEGRIAGFNAAHDKADQQCFQRRTPITIVFTQPNIISVGKTFKEVVNNCVIGSVDYRSQGRATIEFSNKGVLRVYVDHESGCLLGCEGIVPDGEHLAHQLAWAIQQKMTVFDILKMPFYHPVIEEGMRTALRDAARQVKKTPQYFELAMCDSRAASGLS